jgi:SWI/SNF-related matrix-associated actin-dependent regulator of chromatin subfamily B protein 1
MSYLQNIGKLSVVWPIDGRKKREKMRGRKEPKIPKQVSVEVAKRPESLVPIRIEIDYDHYRLRDTFVWNAHDPVVTPEMFVQTTCDDMQLPSPFVPHFLNQLKQQILDFQAHSVVSIDSTVPEAERFAGKFTDEDESWWKRWRKKLRTDEGFIGVGSVDCDDDVLKHKSDGNVQVQKPAEVDAEKQATAITARDVPDERPKTPHKEPNADSEIPSSPSQSLNHEMRILIKLDIIVDSMNLVDQFEWDLSDPHNSPEQFAEVYTAELGLSGEFKTAIIHDIREQVYVYRKSLLLVGHTNDGAAVPDDDLRLSMLPTVTAVARTVEQAEKFTPFLNTLSEAELERNEKEREKELKRKKRQTRGRRGILLPDREPLKTQRTVLGCADISGSLPVPLPTVGTSRRAAAAAASVTIANLAASENYNGMFPLPIPQITQPTLQPPVPAPKPPPKRQKTGLLQAPPIPDRVLRPRAKLSSSVPTPSTALDTSHLAFTSAPPVEPEVFKPGVAEPSTDRKPSSKVLAKRVKESKEKEYAEGQHPNFINGVWHCSNCGCPETIAIGRRKGPLGDKTMCGECGKFYHRHRRPAQVEYNTDEAFHLRKRQAEDSKRNKRRGGGRSTAASVVPQTPEDSSQAAQTANSPAPSANDEDEDMPPPVVPGSTNSSPRVAPAALSPSGSDTPLADRHERPQTPSSPIPTRRSSDQNKVLQTNGSPSTPAPERKENARPARRATPRTVASYPPNAPQWLRDCIDAMKATYPQDNFIALLKPGQNVGESGPEYRIKCFDCPGMLYKPGPDQTLANFEVHLKNRNHRNNVSRRVQTVDA